MVQIIKEKNDFYTSVERAFTEIDKNWRDYKGIVIVGSHKPDKILEKLEMIRLCREHGIPFLGICLGFQLLAMEFARNILGIEGATSQELEPLGNAVIVRMPKLRVGIFPVEGKNESFWHNYKIGEEFFDIFKVHFDTIVSTVNFDHGRVLDYMKLRGRPFFVGVQYHPEYQSSKDKPHPILVEFLRACKKLPLLQEFESEAPEPINNRKRNYDNKGQAPNNEPRKIA